MNPIKQYTIIRSFSMSSLATGVNEWIDKGWEPIGGVSFDPNGWHFQAMIKRAAPIVEAKADPAPEVLHCAKCGWLMVHAPGIGPYCPNKDCDNVDGPAQGKEGAA